MKITHTGVTIKLEEKDRKLISDTIYLFRKIIDELGGHANRNNVLGWSCSLEDMCEIHDGLAELFLDNWDLDRDYDFKTKN